MHRALLLFLSHSVKFRERIVCIYIHLKYDILAPPQLMCHTFLQYQARKKTRSSVQNASRFSICHATYIYFIPLPLPSLYKRFTSAKKILLIYMSIDLFEIEYAFNLSLSNIALHYPATVKRSGGAPVARQLARIAAPNDLSLLDASPTIT